MSYTPPGGKVRSASRDRYRSVRFLGCRIPKADILSFRKVHLYDGRSRLGVLQGRSSGRRRIKAMSAVYRWAGLYPPRFCLPGVRNDLERVRDEGF
jgi:hypothetical protein